MKPFLYLLIVQVFCHVDVYAFTLSSIFGSTDDPQLPAKCYGHDLSESLKSGINDIVVVKQSNGTLKSTPFQARVGKLTNMKTLFKSRKGKATNDH